MYYTVSDVSRTYNVNLNTVLGWISSGELKAVNVGRAPGRKKPRWRIPESALAEFERLRTPSAIPPRTNRRRQSADTVNFY
jgi:excisionase family DNA binding protein